MSFQGWYQIVCKAGHKRSCDCYESPVFSEDRRSSYDEGCPLWICSCGEKAAWHGLVDETNGSICTAYDDETNKCCDPSYCDEAQQADCKLKCGRIDGFIELELDRDKEVETCKCCGHTKVTREATYKIPEGVGHKAD